MKIFMIALVAALCLFTVSQASPEIFSTVSMTAPNKDDNSYAFRWVRVGIRGPISGIISNLSYCAEYNFVTSVIVHAHVRKTFSFGDDCLALIVGKYLNPVQGLYFGARKQPATRWPDGQGIFPSTVIGLGVEFMRSALTVRLSHFDKNTAAATVGLSGVNFFWQDKIGRGITFQHSFNRFANLFAGYTKPVHGAEMYFVQNHVQVLKYLQFYQQYDWGKEKSWLVGLSCPYATDSFVKLFYDTKGIHQVRVELTFSS